MLTDTHAHLDFPELQADLPAVLSRAAEAGVTRIVTIGTGIERSRRAIEIAGQWKQVFAVVGIHPNNVQDVPADFVSTLRECARNPRVVAIGETGLDYYRLPGKKRSHPSQKELGNPGFTKDSLSVDEETVNRTAKAEQAAAFRAHLDLAAELGLPVVIHERDAWDDTLAILRAYTGRVRAVFHCFGKGPALAREVIALGHLVSFTGIVTFKNAPEAQASAAEIPADTFMVETDCPYLAPVPHRGGRCEPAFVRHTAEHIATLRGISINELAAATEATANRFFYFPS